MRTFIIGLMIFFSFSNGCEKLKTVCGIDNCEFVPKKSSSLTMHRFVHTDQRPYSCSICGQQGFLNRFKDHVRKHGKGASIIKTALSVATRSIINQPVKQKNNDLRYYLCNIQGCASKSRSLSKIAKHRRKKHMSQKKYRCSLCNKEFDTKDGKKHIPMCSQQNKCAGQLIRAKLFATARAVLTAPVLGVHEDKSKSILENVITDDTSSIEYLPDSDEERFTPIPLSFENILALACESEESLLGSS